MAGNGQQGATTSTSTLTDIVKSYYPDILTTSYTVPPIHFNYVRSTKKTAPGTSQPVLVQRLSDRDFADFAQQHVLTNLGKLAESRSDVMFIISELVFMNYLKKEPTEESKTSPKPETSTVDGDFDIFIIHRKHGILAGEIKSTGCKESNEDDEKVSKVIKTAIKQLKKSEKKATDMAPGLTVRTTLILPYVSSHQLKRILDGHHQLQQSLLTRLKAENAKEAVKLCLLSDQLSHPDTHWNVTPDVLSKLGAWWDLRMARTEDPLLTDQSYLDFVARLVGPATVITVNSNSQPRIEVRTAGEAIAELARQLVQFVLTPEQVGLMNRNPRRICLTGPPGTGKTVVMELQGLRWLLEGRDVLAVSTARTSRAINIHIEHQLNMMVSEHGSKERTPGTVHLHEYDFLNKKEEDVDRAVEELSARAKDGTLHILMDEVHFTESAPNGKRNRKLVTELASRVPDLHLWAARLGNNDVPPELEEENFTLPLRSAPSVLREVKKALYLYNDISKYSNNGVPSPADGPCVIPLCHRGDGHNGQWPVDCELCGRNVADQLCRLRVDDKRRMVDTCPAPLGYGDVFVLTRSTDLHDDATDKKEKAIPASGFVRGLRAKSVPVCVLGRLDLTHDRERWERDVADIAKKTMNKVTVADSADVLGLERPVVVLLPGRREGSDDQNSEDRIVAQDLLLAASRAMAQLIVVEVPGKSEATHNDVTASEAIPSDATTSGTTLTDVTN